MNKGIIIGISVAMILGIGAVAVSNNYSSEVSETSITEEVNETSITEVKPKQFTVGLEESVGFTGG